MGPSLPHEKRALGDGRCRTLGVYTGLESYTLDQDELYRSGDYASLKEILAMYLTDFPEKDTWGHAYA